MRCGALGLALLLSGCPSPDQEPGADNPWASPPGAAAPTPPTAATSPPPVADGSMQPPSAGSSGPNSSSKDDCQPAAYALEAHPSGGSTVTLSGDVEGLLAQGTMLIELVDPVERMSVYGVACPMKSSFSTVVPADLGEVVLAIFIDSNGNGPDSTDVAGRYGERLQITTEDISGLDITLSAAADLGDIPPPYAMPGGPSTDGMQPGSGEDDEPGGPRDEGFPPGPNAEPSGEPPEADATQPQAAEGASEGSE